MAFATSSGNTYDMTVAPGISDAPSATAGNKNALPKTTQVDVRGFTLKNYINWDSNGKDIVSNATATNAVSNIFKLLEVPAGSVLRQLRIGNIAGQTTVAHAYGSASSASDGKSAVLNIGVSQNKSASGSSTVVDIDALADHALTKKTGALPAGAFGTVSASTPWTLTASQSDTGAPVLPFTFPYGGYITMQLTGGSSTSSVDGAMAGDMLIEAVCDYQPVY